MRRKTGDGTEHGHRGRGSDAGGRNGGAAADDDGALQIEFEDEDAPPVYPTAPAGRARDLRPVTLTSLATVLLGAALWATHGSPSGTGVGPGPSGGVTLSFVPPNYAAYVVTISYRGAHLVSLEQRRIEVDLRVVPVAGAAVRIIDYYISENGVLARADPPPSMTPLPASGVDVSLDLTVTNCSVVPIGESMAFVDVVADGPLGTMDRFTILGDRYSADLARLLYTVCPGRAATQSPSAGANTATAVAAAGAGS